MPLYEYQCEQCKAHFEKIRKFSDPPLTRCEKCGGKLERLLSSPAIQFKGGGWYVTDYARKPASEGDKSATEAAPAKPTESKTSGDGKDSAKPKPAETPSVKK
ncbi:MAG: FmdB family zinc ribbon protein [Terriglobia bacterium]